MKRFRVLTAVLCAAVLLCGFSVPAYAYAGGEGEDYGDPTMETPAPEPTITPGEGFSEEGNLVTRDLLYDEHTNKQFITVQTSGGNTFYIVIDYDKPVDEEGEQYLTYTRPLTEKEASDYELRPAPVISELSRKNDDRPLSIAQQMKEAGALAEASQGDPIHKKKAPDRGR